MVLNSQIIESLKKESGLKLDKFKDFEILCDAIYKQTKRMIGLTTIKRLFGYIQDDRNPNDYTLNTIAIYLGFKDWEELSKSFRINSEWHYDDDSLYVQELKVGTTIKVKYLNRTVRFEVTLFHNSKVLKVLEAENSSLKIGDLLLVDYLKVGEVLKAKTVYRGTSIGNYRTNGELLIVDVGK